MPRNEPRAASRIDLRAGPHVPPSTQGTLAFSAAPAEPGADAPAEQAVEEPDEFTLLGVAELLGVLPEPRAWASTFVQAAMEVAAGIRPAGQLIRWTTPEVHATLVRRGLLTARSARSYGPSPHKPRLRALLLCLPRPGICEVAAVIAEPVRVRAVALRMEGLHGRWRVTALEIG